MSPSGGTEKKTSPATALHLNPTASLGILAGWLLMFRHLFHAPWTFSSLSLILATILFFISKKKSIVILCLLASLWSQVNYRRPTVIDGIYRGSVTLHGLWWKGEYDWKIRAVGEGGEPLIMALRC